MIKKFFVTRHTFVHTLAKPTNADPTNFLENTSLRRHTTEMRLGKGNVGGIGSVWP